MWRFLQEWTSRATWLNRLRWSGLWPESAIAMLLVLGWMFIGLVVVAEVVARHEQRIQTLERKVGIDQDEEVSPVATGR